MLLFVGKTFKQIKVKKPKEKNSNPEIKLVWKCLYQIDRISKQELLKMKIFKDLLNFLKNDIII